jgi:hypothetical protein
MHFAVNIQVNYCNYFILCLFGIVISYFSHLHESKKCFRFFIFLLTDFKDIISSYWFFVLNAFLNVLRTTLITIIRIIEKEKYTMEITKIDAVRTILLLLLYGSFFEQNKRR